MKFRRTQQPQYLTDLAEYERLGEELKNTTREKLAEKFDIGVYGITTIVKLTVDDFRLIQALVTDRRKSMERRRYLRRMISP